MEPLGAAKCQIAKFLIRALGWSALGWSGAGSGSRRLPAGSPEFQAPTNSSPSHQRAHTRPARLWYRPTIIPRAPTNIPQHLEDDRGAPSAPRWPRKKVIIFNQSCFF